MKYNNKLKITEDDFYRLLHILYKSFNKFKEVAQVSGDNPRNWSEYLQLLESNGINNTRARWHLLYTGNSNEWIKKVYEYANDSHIESALNYIIK